MPQSTPAHGCWHLSRARVPWLSAVAALARRLMADGVCRRCASAHHRRGSTHMRVLWHGATRRAFRRMLLPTVRRAPTNYGRQVFSMLSRATREGNAMPSTCQVRAAMSLKWQVRPEIVEEIHPVHYLHPAAIRVCASDRRHHRLPRTPETCHIRPIIRHSIASEALAAPRSDEASGI